MSRAWPAVRRLTKATARRIYRTCDCGETAHECKAERVDGLWHRVFRCRNCQAPILGPQDADQIGPVRRAW